MIKHIKNTYVTHSNYYHLGDIINIIQQTHHRSLSVPGFYRMFSQSYCPCCSVHTSKMMQQIISLLDTKITFCMDSPETYEQVTPMWVKSHIPTPYDSLPYVKAKNLPMTSDHIVCQFDSRSKGDKVPKDVTKYITENMINLGDNKLPCINKIELTLLEKFYLIASAKSYIGIDSGLTHLALMTNTPITLMHPKNWNAKKYYPETNQITYVEL